jgi:serine/threonine protein kinase
LAEEPLFSASYAVVARVTSGDMGVTGACGHRDAVERMIYINMRLLPRGSTLLAPGVRFDAFELVCPLAKGGMADVWIARQIEGTERLVAIKTILPKFAADHRFQQMLVDEARIASRIKHVNVPRILRLVRRVGITYLVMEYVDGESLSAILRALKEQGVAFPPGVLLRIMADVCSGLHAAHELRDIDGQFLCVVHRDVSLPNVLVDMSGVAKLIDFGIAKARDRVGEDTTTGNIKGKICYMAPEQVGGHSLDRRADIWGVGAMMYHCLAGKPPYEAENDVARILSMGCRLPLSPLPGHVPPEIAVVVTRALQYSRSDRFVTAAWMKAAIEEAMERANLATSTAMVASFLQSHIGHLSRKRKEHIAMGLRAARGEIAPEFLKSWNPQPAASPASSTVSSTVVEPLLRRQTRRSLRRGLAVGAVVVGVALYLAWVAIPVFHMKAERAASQARALESSAGDKNPISSSAQQAIVRWTGAAVSADAGTAFGPDAGSAGPRPTMHAPKKLRAAVSDAGGASPYK